MACMSVIPVFLSVAQLAATINSQIVGLLKRETSSLKPTATSHLTMDGWKMIHFLFGGNFGLFVRCELLGAGSVFVSFYGILGQGFLKKTLEWIPPLESIAKNHLEPWKLHRVSFFNCFSQVFLYVGSSRTNFSGGCFGFLGLRVGNPIPSMGLVYLPTFGWFLV